MKRYQIPQLGDDPASPFPPPRLSGHPEGLVAWGGDLEPERLLNGYRAGVFPWYEHGSPILWWAPDPRAVFFPQAWQPPRRLARSLRQGRFQARLDQAFASVIDACAGPRRGQSGTWITPAMRAAYLQLHRLGHAHSVEILIDGQLAGGLYGVSVGKAFFAESKFHFRRDASKIALAVLLRCLDSWDFVLADCQIWNPHLETLGVELLGRDAFVEALGEACTRPDTVGSWAERLNAVNLSDW